MRKNEKGFAIIEMLIAVAILSIVLISIISGISAGIMAIAGNKNHTRAMIIAKSSLNEFQLAKMRGPDLDHEPVSGFEGFSRSREIRRYEHGIFGPITAKRVQITVHWKEREHERKYSLSYIYPEM